MFYLYYTRPGRRIQENSAVTFFSFLLLSFPAFSFLFLPFSVRYVHTLCLESGRSVNITRSAMHRDGKKRR